MKSITEAVNEALEEGVAGVFSSERFRVGKCLHCVLPSFFFFLFCGALRPQETIRLIRDRGAQDGCLDFLTALEL